MRDKKNKAFEPIKRDLTPPKIDTTLVDEINVVLRNHNNKSKNFDKHLNQTRCQLAESMIEETLDEFSRLRSHEYDSKESVKELGTNIKCLTSEITELEKEITEYRQPAEELNKDLHKYLGYNELQLDIKQTGYTITRGNAPADALSEGEITAIALLYFLKSLSDKDFKLDDGVVVLDDPVSSLDSNALFLAFNFIRERTKNADQLFVMTHNFSFFRQVREWFTHIVRESKKTNS